VNKEVEILKIGNIMPVVPITGTKVYDTYQFRDKQTIMVVSDGGYLFDYYTNILRSNCDYYNYLKTTKSIVGKPQTFRSSLLGNQPVDTLKGLSDGDPVVGQSYTINNSSWYTSKVEKIIDDCIIITKNSVYAIHNLSDVREKKLDDLGL
jgi:uncharacterized membrane protein